MACSPRDYFQCSLNQCVLWTQVCDGIANCDNKADEGCGKYLILYSHN